MPDGYWRVARSVQTSSERDVERLVANCRQLDDSPFYVGGELTAATARRRLRAAATGTFLVRDSGHPAHLYSLSVKTPRGVTSIRTVYDVGAFRLDCDPEQVRTTTHYNGAVLTYNRGM